MNHLSFFKYILTASVAGLMFFSYSCNQCKSRNTAEQIKKDSTIFPVLTADSVQDTISKAYLLGKFNPSTDTDFVLVDKLFSSKAMYLRKEVYSAFKSMRDSALKSGISLYVLSATRTFDEQKKIWENKWKGIIPVNGKNLALLYPNPEDRAKSILQYSAMPGTSRHHWGTDIDINAMELTYYNSPQGKKLYAWLQKNAGKFGFFQPYNQKDSLRKTGYEEEKWHWSYEPTATKFLKNYEKRIQYSDISGFLGEEQALRCEVIKNYALSINKSK